MFGTTSSLPPRGLLALIAGVTLLPLATLLWLGWSLLAQDRLLEAEQVKQRLETSADQVVAAIDRSLSTWERQTAPGSTDVPEGVVGVVIRGETVTVTPRSRVAFLPSVPALPEPPPAARIAGDQAEYRTEDPSAALAALLTLSQSTDRVTRTDGLLRFARKQQSTGATDAALATYARLVGVDDIGIAGVPAALAARYARCRLLDHVGRRQELAAEAKALLQDLYSARWPLTAPVYWLYVADARGWTGAAADVGRENERVAEAIGSLVENWRDLSPTQRRDPVREVVSARGESFTVLRRATPDSVSAFVATAEFARQHWLAAGELVARAQQIVLTAGPTRADAGSPTPLAIIRNPADTGLPWAISVAPVDPTARLSEFVVRRQLLVAGFLLLVTMAIAAGYLIVRAVSRELAVARLQSDFVAAVSHEFRTPLTTLRQFTDMLRDSTALTDDRRRICYDAQSRATDRLTRLVESLLDFGRMEAGAQPYVFKTHDVTTLVGAVVDDFRVDAKAAGYDVRFSGNGSAPIRVDKDAFSRAVWNLLDNAVKYSPGGHSVEVDVHRHADDVVIAVRDHGLGIPADEQTTIFTRFQRGAEARSRGIKGTGLGLAMVDLIVKAHRGRIDVESQPGRGSTFSIRIPTETKTA